MRTMTMLTNRFWLTLLRAPDDEGAGATDGAPAGEATDKTTEAAAEATDVLTGEVPDETTGEGQDTASTDGEDAAEGGASEEGKEGDGETEADPNDEVPEDGVYTFEAPEGVEVDEALAAAVSPVFKELGLTRKQAAALNAAYGEHVVQAQAQQVEAWSKQVSDWTKQAKTDPELNPENNDTSWKTTVAVANRALSKLGTPELVQAIQTVGLSNHPEMIRFATRVGKLLADDTTERGESGGKSEAPIEERLYGATTPSKRA